MILPKNSLITSDVIKDFDRRDLNRQDFSRSNVLTLDVTPDVTERKKTSHSTRHWSIENDLLRLDVSYTSEGAQL